MNQAPWLILVGLILIQGSAFSGIGDELNWAAQKQAMLRSIEADVARHGMALGCSHLSPQVVRAMATVPRHLFVPLQYQAHSYHNKPLPIGQGQTISQPTIVAVMTELMGLAPTDTVLEVGTGSGYQAAVLAEVVAHVHTIEIIPQLARSSREILDELGYDNITVYEGDGYEGLPDQAPFDAIMVTAAPPILPQTLLDQLKPRGLLVAPVGPRDGTQWLTVWRKGADGEVQKQVIMAVRFVPMVGRPLQ